MQETLASEPMEEYHDREGGSMEFNHQKATRAAPAILGRSRRVRWYMIPRWI
jgi:hypothetical protein